jgi:hypothetical protein
VFIEYQGRVSIVYNMFTEYQGRVLSVHDVFTEYQAGILVHNTVSLQSNGPGFY